MDKNDVLLVNVIEYHKLSKNLIYFTVTRPNKYLLYYADFESIYAQSKNVSHGSSLEIVKVFKV